MYKFDINDKAQRYQNQPWYVRLWRRRHYLRVPFVALRGWLRERDRREWPWAFHWGMAVGVAQVRMNWVYDWDEIRRDPSVKVTVETLGLDSPDEDINTEVRPWRCDCVCAGCGRRADECRNSCEEMAQ